VHHDFVLRALLVITRQAPRRRDVGERQPAAQFRAQRPDDRADRLRREPRGDARQLHHPHRGQRLDHNVVEPALVFDRPQPGLDLREPGRPRGQRGFELRAPQRQHAAHLLDRDLVGQQRRHLLEGEPEVLQRDDPVEPRQLARRVAAVAGRGVDAGRAQQPDRVVVAQHPDRHPAVAGEVADREHPPIIPQAR
jgi:hypothetical protein